MEPEMHTRVPARVAVYKEPAVLPSPALREYLQSQNIRLYTHQADSYDAVMQGKISFSPRPLRRAKPLHTPCQFWKN